jgi:hypothetical protein
MRLPNCKEYDDKHQDSENETPSQNITGDVWRNALTSLGRRQHGRLPRPAVIHLLISFVQHTLLLSYHIHPAHARAGRILAGGAFKCYEEAFQRP